MLIRILMVFMSIACMLCVPSSLLAYQSEEDKLGEQLIADGIKLGYVSACIVGGIGDHDWMDKKIGTYFRNKYKSFDEVTFAGFFLGAVEHGVKQAKQSSSRCEQMFDWILAIYKECGANPQKVYKGRKGFLEKRKKF